MTAAAAITTMILSLAMVFIIAASSTASTATAATAAAATAQDQMQRLQQHLGLPFLLLTLVAFCKRLHRCRLSTCSTFVAATVTATALTTVTAATFVAAVNQVLRIITATSAIAALSHIISCALSLNLCNNQHPMLHHKQHSINRCSSSSHSR